MIEILKFMGFMFGLTMWSHIVWKKWYDKIPEKHQTAYVLATLPALIIWAIILSEILNLETWFK